MASPASSSFFEGTASPVSPHLRPINSHGHGRIATVTYTYQDGTSVEYPSKPSIAGSSPFTSSPHVFSRSSSQRRRRNRGESFGTELSSTGSARESFQGLHVGSSQPLEIPTNACSVPSHPQAPWTSDVTATGTPVNREHVEFDEDWSTMTSHRHNPGPQVYPQNMAMSWMDESQDQLVANAEPAGQDVFQFDDDMSFNEFPPDQFQPFPSLDPQPALPDPASFNPMGLISASAPVLSTSWMQQPRRPQSTFSGVLDGHLEVGSAADAETVTSGRPKRPPGRVKGTKLSAATRKKANIMRKVGSCEYCKFGKRGCDPGTPCRSCISHFGADVLKDATRCLRSANPLPLIEQLVTQILDVKWHPHPRERTHFFGRDYYVTEWCFIIPIHFPFGPPLERAVQIVQTSDASLLRHQHVNYPSITPKRRGSPTTSVDYVIPVTFSRTDDLLLVLDGHLDMLVLHHFHCIAMPGSDLQILDKVHKLFVHYNHFNQEYGTLLRQALKLLLLPHLSHPSVATSNPIVSHILHKMSPGYCPTQTVTPCLLRAELAAMLPLLARALLQDVLNKILRITLGKKCEAHPVVLAVFAVLMMFIESTSHASSLMGFHAHTRLPTPSSSSLGTSFAASSTTSTTNTSSQTSTFHSTASPLEPGPGLALNATAVWQLLRLYRNCFENCHRSIVLVDSPTSASVVNAGIKPSASAAAARARNRTNSVGTNPATATERVRRLSNSSLAGEKHFSRLVREVGPCAASFLAQVGSEVKERREWLEWKAGVAGTSASFAGSGEANGAAAGGGGDEEACMGIWGSWLGLGGHTGVEEEGEGEGEEESGDEGAGGGGEGVVFDRFLARLLLLWRAEGDE